MKLDILAAKEPSLESLPAWGAWIEITGMLEPEKPTPRRSPHGERGLKLKVDIYSPIEEASLPAWGAWIEIQETVTPASHSSSLPAWGAWIEISKASRKGTRPASLPAWGAWIEIQDKKPKPSWKSRSPHGERGLKSFRPSWARQRTRRSLPAWGAWIEIPRQATFCRSGVSLPAWGAWIEIDQQGGCLIRPGRSPHGERGLK